MDYFEATIQSSMLENLGSIITYHNNHYNNEIPKQTIDTIKEVISRITWKAHLFINHVDSDYTQSSIVMDFYSNTGFGTLEFVFRFDGKVFAQIIDNDLNIDVLGPYDPSGITDMAIIRFMKSGSITQKSKPREKCAMVVVPYSKELGYDKFHDAYVNAQIKLICAYKYKVLETDFYQDWLYGTNIPQNIAHRDVYIFSKLLSIMSKCDAVYFTYKGTYSDMSYDLLFRIADNTDKLVIIRETVDPKGVN